MDTLEYILQKYNLDRNKRSPISIMEGREALPQLFLELGFKVGAEIGTEKGKFAERFCTTIPGLKLYCVDAYSEYAGYNDYVGDRQGMLRFAKRNAAQRLAPYNVQFIYKLSMNALEDIPDESLDFCYIDANHEWPFVAQDIYYWNKKVRKGGILCGHDYALVHNPVKGIHVDVEGVVIGYTHSFKISPWFITAGNHTPSWLWVKQ
jgi:hypothetical protein